MRGIAAVALAACLPTGAHAQDFIFTDGFEDRERPAVGAVIVSEVMSDPILASDATGEWFELVNVTAQRADLGACTVEDASGATTMPPLALHGGARAVIARSLAPETNGGIVADAIFGFSLGSIDLLRLRCDGLVIDETTWGSEISGRARSLDPDFHDAGANDDDANWCRAVTPYNEMDFGSPGSANPQCGEPGPPARPPLPGEVVINEVMPNPAGDLSDASAEWIELRHTGTVRVGLETCALEDGTGSSSALAVTAVDPGEWLLFAPSASSQMNGGLAVQGTFDFALVNTIGSVRLVCGGTLISQIDYPSPLAGRSILRDPDGMLCTAPIGTAEYHPENFGTPGAANMPPCS